MSILTRSESRDGYRVRVLAVHTTEGGGTPQALRDATWWEGSSHAICDEQTLLTPAEGCVPYDRASWTLRSGNRWSENLEIIGYARWTRAEWLARPGRLNLVARWLADRSRARGIPLVKLTPAQYRAGHSGVIGHHDHTVGYSDGTHWDPGPGFPWDVVIAKATAYRNGTPQEDDDMTPEQARMLAEVHRELTQRFPSRVPGSKYVDTVLGYAVNADAHGYLLRAQELPALRTELAGLRAAVTSLAGTAGVDPDDIKAHISTEVDRAMASFRERVAEGYEVRLQPKADGAAVPQS